MEKEVEFVNYLLDNIDSDEGVSISEYRLVGRIEIWKIKISKI